MPALLNNPSYLEEVGTGVEKLDVIAQTATTATLRWTETNIGDYNNDSMVTVSDPLWVGFAGRDCLGEHH